MVWNFFPLNRFRIQRFVVYWKKIKQDQMEHKRLFHAWQSFQRRCSTAMVKLHFHFFLSRRNLTLESVRFLFLPDRAKLLQFKSYLKKVYYGLHLQHCEREHYAGFWCWTKSELSRSFTSLLLSLTSCFPLPLPSVGGQAVIDVSPPNRCNFASSSFKFSIS